MNKSILVGRLTKDPELKTTGNGISVCTFTIAVNRRYKNAEGNYDADFINCVAWRNNAEFLVKHFGKGNMVGVIGSIQTRNYEKDGNRVYITEIAVEEISFVGGSGKSKDVSDKSIDDINIPPDMPMPDGDDLPF